MECPKCGSTIKEGHLYCDKCGEEIRIVPDFDATVDDNIKLSLTDVIDTEQVLEGLNAAKTKDIDKELNKEATKDISVKKDKSSEEITSNPENKTKKIFKALVITGAICAVLVVFIIAAVKISQSVSKYYSADAQYEIAFEQFEAGQYDESVKTLKHCLSIDQDDSRFKLLIADNYYMKGKYDESNAVLYELLTQFPSDINVYNRIIENYKANNDYGAISKLLLESGDEYVLENYAEYLCTDVEFSIEEGKYDEIKYLTLTAAPDSVIFYTVDGTEADENSFAYTDTIELAAGEHVINAVSFNQYGVKSNNVSKTYIIDYYRPDTPVIKTSSGKYNSPGLIDVSFADYETCYYTIDGEDPTADDTRYQGPFAMRIGKHTYKFAVISNKGISSEVASVDVSLELITLVDMGTAKANLVNWVNATGKGGSGFSYECEQACSYNNSTYYIINEYQTTESGSVQTGNHYAVDVLTGMTFRAILNKSTGEYTLEALI